jgi:predicted NAD/FAD-dependent oxidoreductase
MNAASVAVIGAGLAGLACAHRLRESGVHVRVFEAQRAPGGRLATRRFAIAGFDHGAQYLTAADAGFSQRLEEAAGAGAAQRWQPHWPDRGRGGDLWVGSPAMNALPRFLAQDLDVEYGARIMRIERSRRGWSLLDDRGLAHTDFTAVALALPAPAAAALAGPRTPAAARVRTVPMAPCWAALAAFDEPLPGVPDAALTGDGMLAWYARNSSKPGRDAREAFVLHATADWSRVEFDQPSHTVQRSLLDRFSELTGRTLPRLLVADAHRWRHARVDVPLGEDCLLDADAGIGFCGDWCIAPRAEAAWMSGRALGAALAAARGVSASGKIRGSR